MRFVLALGWALAFLFQAVAYAQQTAATDEKIYRLSVGDTIRIEVHEEPDLTLETQLQGDGKIPYPFLGTLQAIGKTVAELQHEITEGLRGDYLINPEVRVRIMAYRPFYVTGQVRRSGGYPYLLGLTVEKAVTLAGGFTDRASRRNIFLVPEGSTQEQKVKVNLDSPVRPGDTLIVEESLF